MKTEDYFKKEVEKALIEINEQFNNNSITQAQFDKKLEEILNKADERIKLRISFMNLKKLKFSSILGIIALFASMFTIILQLATQGVAWCVFVLIHVALIIINGYNFKKYITKYKATQVELIKRCLV